MPDARDIRARQPTISTTPRGLVSVHTPVARSDDAHITCAPAKYNITVIIDRARRQPDTLFLLYIRFNARRPLRCCGVACVGVCVCVGVCASIKQSICVDVNAAAAHTHSHTPCHICSAPRFYIGFITPSSVMETFV